GAPVQGVRVVLTDGKSHSVDSSERAFQYAAIGAFRQAYTKAKPIILEPIMKVAIEIPSEFQGRVMASINQRRGIIISCVENGLYTTIEAEVPLKEMFGYATVLRSLTQGKGEFTMEFSRYEKVPEPIAQELIKNKKKGEKRHGK
ncbi:MAG: elongation factor G, partial [Deltaproteobacteria bacterium]